MDGETALIRRPVNPLATGCDTNTALLTLYRPDRRWMHGFLGHPHPVGRGTGHVGTARCDLARAAARRPVAAGGIDLTMTNTTTGTCR
ncbi:hypothetical protein GA0070604_4189 [Micromonospora eburnea]|uniref:Uncharacterized protein n=2 Tax=Micromonospora eburnea TaxID=227316 RepID=A0A1C6V239_9ACTN|nr:hypothetical protein GA0070604_4189 [Micromonospora eburnea]